MWMEFSLVSYRYVGVRTGRKSDVLALPCFCVRRDTFDGITSNFMTLTLCQHAQLAVRIGDDISEGHCDAGSATQRR